ncbi:MAG: hypothetical protein IPM91_21155 [Bacteroidetes bacterium]|nr:hypothetical protein [Bacteroidota bacterium]
MMIQDLKVMLMTKINDMLQTRLLKTLSIIAQVTMFTSCNSTAQNSSDGLSSQKVFQKHSGIHSLPGGLTGNRNGLQLHLYR